METNNSQDFADYFNECVIIDQNKDEFCVDEDINKLTSEGEFEAEFLRNVGFESLVAKIEAGKDVDDDQFAPLFMSLTNRQATLVKKKITTLKTTVRKRKCPRSKVRDVREVFPLNCETSSGGTRSRSATPDSLDSISPTDSPPSISDDSWFRRGANESPTPSQGYYSNTRSSPDVMDSTSLGQEAINPRWASDAYRRSPGDGCSSPDIMERTPEFVHIFRPPVTRINGYGIKDTVDCAQKVSRSESFLRYRNPTSYDIAGQHRHTFDVASTCSLNSDNGIEALSFQLRGSFYHHGAKQILSYVSESDITLDWREDNDSDWGFEKKRDLLNEDDLPDMVLIGGKLGVTLIEDLSAEDMKKIRSLVLIELSALFDQYNIHYSRRKGAKKKKKDAENCVFSVPLTTLLEQDKRIQIECKIPLIVRKILNHLESGLTEEGILRVPGVVAKVQHLKKEIESNFYSSPGLVDVALRESSINDVAALIKQFLRDLPLPLLTNEYMEAFVQIDKITEKTDQVKALILLVCLLPDVHRDTLKAFLDFLVKITLYESENRMSLQNVAMIIAPNLFLPKKQKKNSERDLAFEINLAAVTCRITKMLIKYKDILMTVPNFLVQQIRRQNEQAMYRRRGSKENWKHGKKYNGKMKKTDICRQINNEVDFQDGIIRINALQFGKYNEPIKLTESTTGRDVVLQVINHANQHRHDHKAKGRKDVWRRALSEVGTSDHMMCFLTSADDGIKNHALYEVGGNIAERRVDPNAHIMAVYQQNPNAEWEIRCQHLTSQPVFKKKILVNM
uniref:Rho-GAP domain-containing protein n=1 Tax=Strigamia maritima TaxID=126957 RepID=T1JKW0_STRMM